MARRSGALALPKRLTGNRTTASTPRLASQVAACATAVSSEPPVFIGRPAGEPGQTGHWRRWNGDAPCAIVLPRPARRNAGSPPSKMAGRGREGLCPLGDGKLRDAPERTPGQRVVGRSRRGETGRRAAGWRVLADFVADAAADESVGDRRGGAGGDRCGEWTDPVAHELGSLVPGLHLQPAGAVVLQPLALPVEAPVARLAQCRDQSKVEQCTLCRQPIEHDVPSTLERSPAFRAGDRR